MLQKIILSFLCLVILSGCAMNPPTPTQSPTPSSSSTLIPQSSTPQPDPSVKGLDAFEQNKRLGRGVNLGNALEAPKEGEWGVTLKEEYFSLIKSAGFDSVRIPIRWSAHASQTSPYTIDTAFFERIDWAIDQALQNNLQVVINMHHYEEIFTDPAAHQERYLALWEQIAAHYQDYPDNLVFEILNEPNNKLTDRLWNDLLVKALAVVRQTNPERNVIIGPAEWNSLYKLSDLTLPEDDRHIIVTFHYYLPFQFTHQGAEWAAGSNAWLGTTWMGTTSQEKALERDLDLAADWAKKNNRPLYLGEFGAYSKADMDSRAIWTDAVARQAEARDMSWAYWEFCAGFGVYDPQLKLWRDPLLEALIPSQ
jgi:endoglucanase